MSVAAEDEAQGGIRGRFRLEGEVTIRVPGGEAALSALEVDAEGGLRAPTGRVSLTLSGPLREVRRLGALSPALAALLAHVKEEDESRAASLTLVATPSLVARLREAGEAFDGEPLHQDVFQNEPYVGALLSLLDYAPEKVSVVTASWRG